MRIQQTTASSIETADLAPLAAVGVGLALRREVLK